MDLTKREHYACEAMKVFLASKNDGGLDHMARLSFRMADAMHDASLLTADEIKDRLKNNRDAIKGDSR